MAEAPRVEILSFDGCPNHEGAEQLVAGMARELGIDVDVKVVDVPDAAAAVRERFLGSPTIRVDGVDVEPGAADRDDFGLACRVFQTPDGLRGQPNGEWVRHALLVAHERRQRPEGQPSSRGM